MQPFYFSALHLKKIVSSVFLFVCLFWAGTTSAQTTIFSEDFESAPAGTTLLPAIGWDIYTPVDGNSRWGLGDASCAISGAKSLYVVRNTVGNPCDYAPSSATNRIAFKSFSTTNYNTLKLSFKWICNGEKIGTDLYDFGRVCVSLDGISWTNLPGNYQGELTTQNVVDLNLPAALEDQPVVYLGFRWINDGSTKNIPGFVIDDIVVKGTLITPPSSTPALTSLGVTEGCAGSTLTITGTSLGSATGVTIGGTPATITANTATSVTVTVGSGTTGNVVVTTAGGVSNGLPFTVKPTPVVTVTPPSLSLCVGDTTDIVLSTSVPGATYTYVASQLSGAPVSGFAGCLSGCPSTIAQILTVGGSSPGVVRYTVTATAGGCSSAPVDVDVTVNPTAPATVTPASDTLCSGTPTGIALSTGISGATFTWAAPTITGGTVTGATAGSGSTISQTIINTGSTPATVTYTITPTNPGGCTQPPVTATVLVNPGPAITTQPVGNTQCGGDYTFSVTAVNAVSYQWYGPGGIIPGATTSSYTITGATAALSGGYYVVVTGAFSCAPVTSTTASLVISNPIVITGQPVNQQACEGTPITLSVTSSGATSFQWYKNGNPIAGATAASYTIASPTLADAGSYYVKLVAAAPCASANSNTVTVTVSNIGTWHGLTNDWNNAANWCGGIPTATSNVVLPATGSVPFDAHIKNSKLGIANNITLQNSTLTVDPGGSLQLYGNLSLSPGGSLIADNGTVRLSGTTDQLLQPGFSTGTLFIEGGSNKNLNQDIKVTNILQLGSGKVMLNGNILRMAPGANIYGVSATSYVVTNGEGGGLQQVVGVPEYIFPVGQNTFNPLYMSNNGEVDSFLVKVREEVLENGSAGAPVNPALSSVILRTWDVTEATTGGSDATLTLQWNAGEENTPDFTYAHTYVSQFKDGIWVNTCCGDADSAGVAVGAGPFTRTKSGITDLTHFTVASAAGETPLLVGGTAAAGFDLTAYPNPVSDVLTVVISGSNAQSHLAVLDMTGRELMAKAPVNGSVTFDMHSLAQGIYFVKYTDGQQIRTIKVSRR